ncbi:unnamed protein product [Orchesella dallaii]|uniref:Carboxylic ester hydrolase n=1 Tax=Orchesella dallaii TaxID=48710 RepID=A0ABP1QS01_9HEXA
MLFTAVHLANLLFSLPCIFFNCQYLRPAPVTSIENSPVEQLTDRVERSYDAPDPIVNTTNGMVEGYLMGVFNRKIYAFESIAFGESPVGALRWRDPVPKRPWSGVRQAKKISTECLQFNLPRFFRVLGQEDCLQLNIYTPQVPSGDYNPKFAVMVFIHGGSFIMGTAADYGPAYLMQENIILVTINYRVGVLGFLSTGDDEGLGNWGLKDQALAIKWVHDNIVNFGGDPTKITISGHSSGAACVHLHMISSTNVAKGLYL